MACTPDRPSKDDMGEAGAMFARSADERQERELVCCSRGHLYIPSLEGGEGRVLGTVAT